MSTIATAVKTAFSALIVLLLKAFNESGKVWLTEEECQTVAQVYPIDVPAPTVPEGIAPIAEKAAWEKHASNFSKDSKDALKKTKEGFEAFGSDVAHIGDDTPSVRTVTLRGVDDETFATSKLKAFIETAKTIPMQVVKARPDKDGKLSFCKSAKAGVTVSGLEAKDEAGNEYFASVNYVVNDSELHFAKLCDHLYKVASLMLNGEMVKAYNILLLAYFQTDVPLVALAATVQARIYSEVAKRCRENAEKAIIDSENMVMSLTEQNAVPEEVENDEQ